MILPLFAIALLAVITVYSSIASFRQNPTPSWIFPEEIGRSIRIAVAGASFAIVIGVALWLSLSVQHASKHSLRFLIPEGYMGWVRVEFEVAGASALPVEAGDAVIKIPLSGILRTSSAEQSGSTIGNYFFYSDSGVRPLPRSGPGRLIWGKINGEESGSSGKRKYEEFFVGTEQQYRDQVKNVR